MEPQEHDRQGAPPWRLRGEAVAALARIPSRRSPRAPDGVRPVPGPALILAAHWDASPMGPYRELAIGVPARIGIHAGWCITTMVVDSATSCSAGREHWGFPKEMGSLEWRPPAAGHDLRWEERGIEVRAGTVGPARAQLPVWLPVPLAQRRLDGAVTILGRVRARMRPASVELTAPGDDPLSALAGRHPGAVLSAVDLWIPAARRP